MVPRGKSRFENTGRRRSEGYCPGQEKTEGFDGGGEYSWNVIKPREEEEEQSTHAVLNKSLF